MTGAPQFTPDQQAAIETRGPLRDTCVVAGPGSGKTTVLVEHFKRLVETHTDPLRILAITFTEKAAANMRSKLAQAFEHDPAVRASLERAWVSTVHGFCGRLLRENAVFAGIDPEFTVADARQAWRIQQDSMSAAMDELFQERPDAVRALIRGLSSAEFEQAVLSAYDAMRGAGTRVEELDAFPTPRGATVEDVAATLDALKKESLSNWSYAQREYFNEIIDAASRIVWADGPLAGLRAIEDFKPNLQKCKRGTGAYEAIRRLREDQVKDLRYTLITEYYEPQRRLLIEILRRFDTLYRARKRQAGVLDFADLEEYAVRLLRGRPETQARLRAQFDHILMDEFQDTNGQQNQLLELIRAADRFYAVGDINQSIYGFRHAEPEGFSQYRDDVEKRGARLVQLVANFRSRPEILRAVETVVHGAEGIEERRLVPGKKFLDAPDGAPVEVIAVSGPDAGEALRLEAQWVARRIAELACAGAPFRDMAVLVRNTEVIPAFTAAFDRAAIPCVVNCGRGFYDSRETVDLTHLLRVIANPRDEISVAAVLRSPLVGVSDEALLRLKLRDSNLGRALAGLNDAAEGFDAEDAVRLERFRDRLGEWRARREYVTFDRLLAAAIDDCAYPAESSANVDKFLAEARAAASRMSLDELVEELEIVRKEDPREPDPPPDDSADAVKVMTVHSAKGLEFPIVFVAALHKGVEGDPPVVAFSRRIGLGARWRNPAGKAEGRSREKDDRFEHAIREERDRREAEEANRLLYVAMTRAEQRLVLSFSGNGKRLDNWAARVAASLDLDLETPRDEVVTQASPYGEEWPLRILIADRAPELLGAPGAAAAERRAAQEWLPRPDVTGQHDGNVTATALAEFARCPRRYFLGKYLGFGTRRSGARCADDPGRDLPADEFGTQVHELLAGKSLANADPEAVRLAGVFQSGALGRRLANAARVEREFDFLLALEDLVVRGQIDLWFEEAGRIEIVDYKTDAVSAAEAPRRTHEYALQLRIYAMAVERLTGRAPDRAWLHFLRPNAVVEVDLSPSLLDGPEHVIADFITAQENLDFPLRETDACPRCPYYKGLCPAGVGQASWPQRSEERR
jgi:ATP-dependent exoDNAse (exonuclease V) beta subunit